MSAQTAKVSVRCRLLRIGRRRRPDRRAGTPPSADPCWYPVPPARTRSRCAAATIGAARRHGASRPCGGRDQPGDRPTCPPRPTAFRTSPAPTPCRRVRRWIRRVRATKAPNVSYLKDLWQAVQNHEISGKEALIMGIAQRGMNTPYPDQAPGPNVPTSPADPALAPPPPPLPALPPPRLRLARAPGPSLRLARSRRLRDVTCRGSRQARSSSSSTVRTWVRSTAAHIARVAGVRW